MLPTAYSLQAVNHLYPNASNLTFHLFASEVLFTYMRAVNHLLTSDFRLGTWTAVSQLILYLDSGFFQRNVKRKVPVVHFSGSGKLDFFVKVTFGGNQKNVFGIRF